MESTYGDKTHGDITQMHNDLERVVRRAIARGGKIIVPAFAVGRTQELIYALNELKRQGRLPPIRIFVDSPLAINVTEVFKLHPECFDAETRGFLGEHGDIFGFDGVEYVGSREESIALNDLAGPAMIISAAGMAEAGRVLHHLRNNVEDERNTILIVGFMAQHTLGRRLVERRPRVRIWGVERDLRAHVEVLDAFSAHADRNDLLNYADACGAGVRRFFLVHGELQAQESLRDAMEKRERRVAIPERGENVELG
jgi:metallo-beta-lactamase family protein